jgi:hypothetical protein
LEVDSEVSQEEGSLVDLDATDLLTNAVDNLSKSYPGIERNSIALELLRLSTIYGDAAVANVVGHTITNKPKAPLAYITKALAQSAPTNR